MEREYQILKVNIKHNLIPHLAVLVIFLAVSPLIIGMKNLTETQVCNVLEVYGSIFGVILLIPVFIPDLDLSIRHLIVSKKESILKIHLLRLLEQVILLAVVVAVFMVIMKCGNCQFSFWKCFYGTMANCILLGGFGVLGFALYNSLPFAYMIPMFYYMLNFGNDKSTLGNFYLFTMTSGSFYEKNYNLAAGVIMVALGIIYRSFIRNRR